jgi:hypothetical protein
VKFPTVRKSNPSLLGSPLQLYSFDLIVVACCALASRPHNRVHITQRLFSVYSIIDTPAWGRVKLLSAALMGRNVDALCGILGDLVSQCPH